MTNADLQFDEADQAPAPGHRQIPRGVLWACALAVVVLAIATFVAFTSGGKGNATKLDPNGSQPPPVGADVTGQSVSSLAFERFDGGVATGQQATFAAYAGTPLVINFFASYCVPCATEMPDLQAASQSYSGSVRFVGIDVLDQPDAGKKLIDQTGVTYDLGRDPDGNLLAAVGSANMPTTVFVDARGTIVDVHLGKLDQGQIEQLVHDHFGT